MMKFLFWPSRQIGMRFGGSGSMLLVLFTISLLPVALLVLPSAVRLPGLVGLTGVIIYGFIGHRIYSLEAQLRFDRRLDDIANDILVPPEKELREVWYKRSFMELTILFGKGLSAIQISTRDKVERMSLTAEKIAVDANGLSGRAEEIAAMLEETASGMEEFAATIERSAESCKRAHLQSGEVMKLAQQGSQGVTALSGQIQASLVFNEKIRAILATIDEIAIQINILALNASIEAARAGDQGRAFAVVATEVRKLAMRTSSSTKKVGEALDQALEISEAGTWLAKDATSAIHEMVQTTNTYSRLVGDIATSANEQSAGVEQIKMAVEQMAGLTQRNASSVDELKSIASGISRNASQFEQSISHLNHVRVEAAMQPNEPKKLKDAP